MNIKKLKDKLDNKLLADDVPIIVLDAYDTDVSYGVRIEQNRFGRWAVFIDVDAEAV